MSKTITITEVNEVTTEEIELINDVKDVNEIKSISGPIVAIQYPTKVDFSSDESTVKELTKKYSDLTRIDVDDKEAYKRLSDAIKDVKKHRSATKKEEEAYKKPLNEFRNVILNKAKSLIGSFQKIEDSLTAEKKRIDDIKQERLLAQQKLWHDNAAKTRKIGDFDFGDEIAMLKFSLQEIDAIDYDKIDLGDQIDTVKEHIANKTLQIEQLIAQKIKQEAEEAQRKKEAEELKAAQEKLAMERAETARKEAEAKKLRDYEEARIKKEQDEIKAKAKADKDEADRIQAEQLEKIRQLEAMIKQSKEPEPEPEKKKYEYEPTPTQERDFSSSNFEAVFPITNKSNEVASEKEEITSPIVNITSGVENTGNKIILDNDVGDNESTGIASSDFLNDVNDVLDSDPFGTFETPLDKENKKSFDNGAINRLTEDLEGILSSRSNVTLNDAETQKEYNRVILSMKKAVAHIKKFKKEIDESVINAGF